MWTGQRGRYSDWLRAGRSGDRFLVKARFSAPVQTGPGAHPASCTMGTGPFPGVKSGRGVTLTPHPLLQPWSWKRRAIPLLPLQAVRPVQRALVPVKGCTLYSASCWLFSIDLLTSWWHKDIEECKKISQEYHYKSSFSLQVLYLAHAPPHGLASV
jgi:hypothetical protein